MKIYKVLSAKEVTEFDVILETEMSYFTRSKINEDYPDIYFEECTTKKYTDLYFLTKEEAELKLAKIQKLEALKKELAL